MITPQILKFIFDYFGSPLKVYFENFPETSSYYVFVGILSSLIVTIFLNGFNAAVSSILLCSMEDLSCSDKSCDRKKRSNDVIQDDTYRRRFSTMD